MKEKKGDIWLEYDAGKVVVVTTNGYVKADDRAVMGRGIALQAAKRFPLLPESLGSRLKVEGNHVLWFKSIRMLTFPVKPAMVVCNKDRSNVVKHMREKFKPGQIVPGWAAVAELELIEKSALELDALVSLYEIQEVHMPRPGCGAGELEWEQVEPILHSLDSRFVVHTF